MLPQKGCACSRKRYRMLEQKGFVCTRKVIACLRERYRILVLAWNVLRAYKKLLRDHVKVIAFSWARNNFHVSLQNILREHAITFSETRDTFHVKHTKLKTNSCHLCAAVVFVFFKIVDCKIGLKCFILSFSIYFGPVWRVFILVIDTSF